MRTAKEINTVFKSNFKRDIEIFKCWVLGFSLEDISKQVELRASYIRATILKRAERAIMFSNGLCWDDMPGHKPSEVIDYQNPEFKGFYLSLINKSLAIDLKGDL